MMRLELV